MSDPIYETTRIEIAPHRKEAGTSDDVIRDIFRLAANEQRHAAFLRLGGPRLFREEVIRVTTEEGSFTKAFQGLQARQIPGIEFVLADPRFEPFLGRMDAEHKSIREIWRVRRDVLAFARGLLNAGRLRAQAGLQPILVAFHRKQLLWNLSIAGTDVAVRAYYHHATGHDDSVAEVLLHADGPARLAESMLAYYRSIRDDETTVVVTEESRLEGLCVWPSLYKGNAVWPVDAESSVKQGGDAKWPAGLSYVKLLPEAETRIFEVAWLNSLRTTPQSCRFFRPVSVSPEPPPADDGSGGYAIRMVGVRGVTAEELLFAVQRMAAAHPEFTSMLTVLADAVLNQAVCALTEFHAAWQRMAADTGRTLKQRIRPYPWRDQVDAALREAGRFMTQNGRLLDECRQQLNDAATTLEEGVSVPFRDAHLKNRLISIDPAWLKHDAQPLLEWLQLTPHEEIPEWLRRHTYDIDFETSRFLVTESDDAMHILFSPNTGWRPGELLTDGAQLVRDWWPLGEDVRSTELTLLCRSIRELCRRVWYANVMPNTFVSRYRTERRDHFLTIARSVATSFPEWPHVAELLDICESQQHEIWSLPEQSAWAEPLVMNRTPQLRDVPPPNPPSTKSRFQVFISCHHEDYAHGETVYQKLKQRGISAFFCLHSLPGSQDTDFRRKIADAIEMCRHMVVVAGVADRAASGWVEAEWGIFLNEKRSGRKPDGNLITINFGEFSVADLPIDLRGVEMVRFSEEGFEKVLKFVTR